MDFRKTILASMQAKSITRYRLSKDTGIPASTLRDWLDGRSMGMTSQHLEKVLEYLTIEISPKGRKGWEIMKLNRLKDEFFVGDILKRHGFKLITPDIHLGTAQIWDRDGKQYRFIGWESNKSNKYNPDAMADNPKYIEVESYNVKKH